MRFGELMQSLGPLLCRQEGDAVVTGLSYDSRQVKPGDIFVAIPGFKADGHDFILLALEQGAVGVVVSREVNLPRGVPFALVSDSRRALSRLAAHWYGYPARQMSVIGVTGTNGKTTTTYLCEAIMRAAGWKTGLCGTVTVRIAAEERPAVHTTPESLELQALLAEMRRAGVQGVAMEVSSHALALHRSDDIDFAVAVFTNMTQDHLDFHRDMEDYFRSKARLFTELLPAGRQPRAAVVNGDDPYGRRLISLLKDTYCRVYTYGLAENCQVRAVNIQLSPRRTEFTLLSPQGEAPINLQLSGYFNVYNALAAATAGLALGLPLVAVKQALDGVEGVPGRFERVEEGQDFTVIVDYAHTPDGLLNVLKTARSLTSGRLWVVFGCGGDRDPGKRPQMGEIAARLADVVVVTSDNPRSEEPLSIIAAIEEGIKRVAGVNYVIIPDRRAAIKFAIKGAEREDLVLIAGKGHENYQIVGTTRLPFDDRYEARLAIRERLEEKTGR